MHQATGQTGNTGKNVQKLTGAIDSVIPIRCVHFKDEMQSDVPLAA